MILERAAGVRVMQAVVWARRWLRKFKAWHADRLSCAYDSIAFPGDQDVHGRSGLEIALSGVGSLLLNQQRGGLPSRGGLRNEESE